MRKKLIAALSVGAAATGCAEIREENVNEALLSETIDDNEANASLGALASMVGESEDVREFGTKLAADHIKAKEETVAVAKALGVKASDEAEAADAAAFDKLQQLSGEDFDTAFAHQMVVEYSEDITKSEQQATSTEPKIAALAEKQLPVLRENLKAARELASNAEIDTTAG